MNKRKCIKQEKNDGDLTEEMNPESLWDYLTRTIPEGIILYDRKGESPYIDVSELMTYSGVYKEPWENKNNTLCQRIKIAKAIMESVLGERFPYYIDNSYRYFDKLEIEQFMKLYIALDPAMEGYGGYEVWARRPYYQMRGKRISEELAIEIIARTDNYFRLKYDDELLEAANFVGCMNFDQWWFDKNHIPTHYGWCHPNGIIGENAITQKFPNIMEFIEEAIGWIMNFPALDLMIGVTNWDEKPYHWDDCLWSVTEKVIKSPYEVIEDFVDNIAIGINVHENTVEILNSRHARERYLIYEEIYEEDDHRVYIPEYYQDRDLFICDEQYLKRCEEILGIR